MDFFLIYKGTTLKGEGINIKIITYNLRKLKIIKD